MNDDIRLLIMATIQSLFPVLAIFDVIELSAEELATIMIFVGNVTLIGARVFKSGQGVSRSTHA